MYITSRMCKKICKSNSLKGHFKVKNCEQMFPFLILVSPTFRKFMLHHFAFTKDLLKEIQTRFSLLQKKAKSKNCSDVVLPTSIPTSESGTSKLLPQDLHSASQHQATTVLNCVCEHLCFILILRIH